MGFKSLMISKLQGRGGWDTTNNLTQVVIVPSTKADHVTYHYSFLKNKIEE
jgi:hypothetical protein